nr:ABC transporter substrate-binding protein [Paucilactobacillus hokkaidonensis]
MYHAKHPNVNIQITTSGQGGGAAALQAKFASGEAPDIIMLGGLPEIDRYKDHLINLKDLKASKNIVPNLVSGGISNKRMVGIPVDLEAYGWSYNKAVFAKAGIDASKINNYSEFLKAVEKLNSEKRRLESMPFSALTELIPIQLLLFQHNLLLCRTTIILSKLSKAKLSLGNTRGK